MMQYFNWQKQVMDEKDLEVIEIIATRNSGKSILGVAWVSDEADTSVIISPHAKKYNSEVTAIMDKYNIKPKNKIHVISNLEQLRKIPTHDSKRVKIVVDEYFMQPQVTLKELDRNIGHENFKAMFIGTRLSKQDKFKCYFSKQYTVDIIHLLTEGMMNLDHLNQLLMNMSAEEIHMEFGAPFETN